MQAILLAAGQGTRLRPLTHDRPKSMLNAAGRPLIEHLLRNLAGLGLKDVTIVSGHGHDVLHSFVGDGARFGVKVHYAVQDRQLGPGHALQHARSFVRDGDFLLLPADTWLHPDLVGRLMRHTGPALVEVPDARSGRHGVPVVKADKVVALAEGSEVHEPAAFLAGAYRMPAGVFDALDETQGRLRDAIRVLLRDEGPWGIERAKPGEAVDVMDVEDLLLLHLMLMAGQQRELQGRVEPGATVEGAVHLGKGSVVRAGSVVQGPAFIGDNCDIGPCAAVLSGASLRNHVRLGPFSLAADCTIGSNVTVASHVRIRQAVLDNGVEVGAGAVLEGGAGLLVGADARIGPDARILAGGRIGRGAQVAAGRQVHLVPDGGVAV